MANRIVLMSAAGAVSIAIACLVLLGAGWFSEALMPLFMRHHQAVSVAGMFMGTFGGMFAIFAGYRCRKSSSAEEALKPRIRNGRID